MVTGRLPFEGETVLSVALKHKSEAPSDPKKWNPQTPVELSRVILKCMAKSKEKRYQTADEVYEDLNRLEAGMTTTHKALPKTGPVPRSGWKSVFRKPWLPIAILILAAAAVLIGFLLRQAQRGEVPTERNMLVVLPFENLGDPEDEYFADGITEEITSRLAALQGLGIISRTSAIQYKKTGKSIRQIGGELGVDYVLEGSVRWNRGEADQGRVRITPQLIRVSDDTQIWSERYDRVIEDIFTVQSDIAEQVARQLDLTVLEPERAALNARHTENIEAYDLYLQGRDHEDRGWAHLDLEEFDLAVLLYDKAVELDPNFALPLVRLSYVHSRMYFFSVDRTEERLEKARETVTRALELEPDLPEAYRSLGFYYYWGLGDYNRAAEVFEAVQRARPNFDPQLLGYIQRRQGKWEECLATLERAFRINPRDAQIAYELGGAYISLHRFEEAETWLNRALSIFPDHLPAQLQKAAILVLSEGDTGKAKSLLERLPEHQLTDYMWITLCMLERDYRGVLDRLDSLGYDSFEDQHLYFQKDLAYAIVYQAMKDIPKTRNHAESARRILEEAVGSRDGIPSLHASLGLAYALLGRADEAVLEGNRAVTLHPVSRDAAQGPIYLQNLAKIYTLIGRHEEAIDQLEYLISLPQAEYLWQLISVPQLRLDPQWDNLRDYPRFKRLLEIT